MKTRFGLQVLRSPFVLYTLFMILKSLHVRRWMYEDTTFWEVLAVELSAFLILFAVVELTCRRGKRFVYFVLTFLLSTVYLGVLVFYRQFHRIPMFESLYLLGEAGSVQDSIAVLLEPSDVLMYLDLIVVAMLALIRKNPMLKTEQFSRKALAGVLVLSLFVSVYNISAKRAQDVLDPSKFAKDVGLLNAEAFQAIQESRTKEYDTGPITQEAVNAIKGIVDPAEATNFGVAQGKNLIVIQLESFQNFVIGRKVDGQEITPNLNKLLGESQYFDHFNTMIGQGNTSDAEFITNTSLYPLESGAMSTIYKDKDFPSLPKLLSAAGYDTFTMHVNDVSFYNRNRMYPNMGYDQYYDKKYFGEEDVISMGASDNVLYRKSIALLQERQQRGQPFYANYVTLSSHHPFKIPAGADGLTLSAEYAGKDSMLGDYLRAVHYTDAALGTFFDELKAKGLWDNTVIALYGDHFAFHADSVSGTDSILLNGLLGRIYDMTDMLNVPLIVRVPGMPGQVRHGVGGQIDTLPTLSNLLGISLGDQIHFGQDLLNQPDNLLGELFYLPTGSFVSDNVLYNSEDQQTIHLQTHQRAAGTDAYHDPMNKVMELERLSRSYIEKLPSSTKKS
ncbi:LTA synthase family protein [Tumebacillus permanentifrigoris]|uniref:Phosphoglycerol transferase MdoB-like AlkP superfamily enzyme n=1 Tax=Tumebacillus permanentifrigoris TaxID=378543 RepID=A0A316DDE7_9BACL|nr:LTA synthase family protein [Tumebacillus permanentifrigoris]PWK13488.1 phosphoglycerol transferase MdoB-like AlkP superfamily enzyme [Tumebacillus permanentifrigoris]